MKEALVDVSVLLVFFARPDTFEKVFEQVKKARPRRLFLYQDGPRLNRHDDFENIEKCRKIAEDIDWECEVHKLYQTENKGCNPSGYIAHSWAFSLTDKCIVLEDDVVPSVSFFTFCKEMLDKYEFDERVMLISGINLEEITENIDGDYFFTSCTSIWGWASWKRVISQWDTEYMFLDNDYYKTCIDELIKIRRFPKAFVSMCRKHRETGKEFFETILISNQYLNSGLSIVPKKNMINNIGVSDDSTHFSGNINTLPRGYRRIFTMQRYELDRDIQHPKYIIENYGYKDRTYRIKAWGHPFVKIYRLLEMTFYRLKYDGLSGVVKMISNMVNQSL